MCVAALTLSNHSVGHMCDTFWHRWPFRCRKSRGFLMDAFGTLLLLHSNRAPKCLCPQLVGSETCWCHDPVNYAECGFTQNTDSTAQYASESIFVLRLFLFHYYCFHLVPNKPTCQSWRVETPGRHRSGRAASDSGAGWSLQGAWQHTIAHIKVW